MRLPAMAPRKRKAAEAEPATEQANKLRSVCKAMDESAAEFLCCITQELPIDPVKPMASTSMNPQSPRLPRST